MSALIGLTASLSTETAQAQLTPCATGLFDGITWRESTVHIGDTVHFTINLTASGGNPPAGVCRLQNGTNWVVLPDGTVRIINMNFSKGSCPTALNILCPPDGGGVCVGGLPTAMLDGVLWFEYGPIQPADNGRATLFVTPARPAFGPAYPGTPVTLFGTPGFISVAAVADAPALDCESGTIFRGKASASGNQPLVLVSPCISITKDCVLNCPPTNAAAFGQRIDFQGTVRNCGDITLTNVTVVDQLPAGATPILGPCGQAICFGNVQPGNTPFNGALQPGQSVTYSGAYQPGGSGVALCGPFRDVVTASGTDASSIPRTVTATDDAVCTVCTAPCIEVIKDCIDTQVDAGNPIRYSFIVTNCGNVPLQNVVAVDDNATPTNPADDITTVIGDLAIGGTRVVQGTIQTSTNDCRIGRFSFTNTVRVTGANICNPAQTVSDSDDCVATLLCPCDFEITKEVACFLPGNACDTFAKSASGVREGTNCPAFCYRFTIRNTGFVPLTPGVDFNIADDKLGNLNGRFGPFPVGGPPQSVIVSPITHCENSTNIFTVSCTERNADGSMTTTTKRDTNNVIVVPIAVACIMDVSTDGGSTFFVPGQDCARVLIPDSYIVRVRVSNTGNYPLQNVTVTTTGLPLCFASPLNLGLLAIGETKTNQCTFTCSRGNTNNYSVSVVGEASQVGGKACDFNLQGIRLQTRSSCATCVICVEQPSIQVWKQVVCYAAGVCEPFNADLNTQKTATGVRIDPPNAANCPAFCYRITVRNTGNVPLTLTVSDNSTPDPDLNLAACGFPPVLAVGATAQCVVPAITHCANTLNVVTANGVTDLGQTVSARDTNNVTILPLNIACELQVSTNGGASFFNPGASCPSVVLGNSYIVRIKVTNTGQHPLQNVTITSVAGLAGCLPTPRNIGTLAINEMKTVDCTFTCTVPGMNEYAVSVVGEASKIVGNVCDHNVQGVQIVARSECRASVCCVGLPRICVEKLVTCKDPGVTCENATGYAKSAQGVRGENDPNCPQPNSGCPAFCYKVTVRNCGQVDMRDVTLRDDNGTPGNTADDIATPIGNLAVNESRTVYYSSTHCTDAHNIVVAEGQSVFDSTANGRVRAEDFADVTVHPIMIMCRITLDAGTFDMDGRTADDLDPAVTCRNGGVVGDGAEDNALLLPQGFSGVVCFNLYLTNPKNIDLDVTVTLPAAAQAFPALVACIGNTPILVQANSTRIISCTLDFDDCLEEFDGEVEVKGTARATGAIRCLANACGNAATTAPSTCSFSTRCALPPSCRTTGGGNLLPGFVDQSCIPVATTIFPSVGVDHISHGGQLGAPFSQMDCGTILGNPCIRGQWEHQRHYQGNGNPREVIDMNFHSATPKGVFDSLSCACLGCCDPVTGAFIPPTQGPLIKKFAVCNPNDRKNGCGPMPRPAPANAIIFSGIGRITPTDDISGPRASRSEWVIFRVYIEDRSEPGNAHAGGQVDPPDIYCFQAWKTGIKTTRKPDFTTIATAFRMALGQANCDYLRALETGALPIGTMPSPTVNGLTADIQDCGPLYNGNRQIHPSTGATCDE